IPRVRAKVSYARFIIAGADNSWHDGFQLKTGMDYPTYFSKRYPDAASCVTFTGSVDEGQLRALYQSCDLFVAPSLYESFGLIYLEAMNYAKPVIGCRAGGIPEVVDHGVSGLLVEPEAPLALTEAIVSLLTSPSRLREMGLAGRQRLLDQFTHIHMARSFAQAYRAAIAGFNAESEGRADSEQEHFA
ncbi:MAG TPA: glycosyltransferase family 4 protein, partial [Anaerolineae bacterium]